MNEKQQPFTTGHTIAYLGNIKHHKLLLLEGWLLFFTIDSADPVETMAMNNITNINTAPAWPSRWYATAGGTNPEPASSTVIGSIKAVEANPREVAREKGIANQQRPPKRYPRAALAGLAAIADCQYDWSTKTVPKLPTMLMIPNMSPSAESIVK
mmetsp:Transcript_65755/g.73610  ORF Transcript_65755/g.73610 Transcript_65755/m.73610 type:complete len:155 (+) Transcript_65755:157-621(+)